MIKRNKINRNKVKSGMSRRKKILLSAMVASSLLFADGLYTTYVYADGGQEIHGISVNVDPGGEPGNNYNNDGAGYLGVAIGNRASSLAGYGTAIGPYAKADALYSNATGFWAQALGQYSAAYGAGARAINNFGVAFGQGSVVSFGKPISEAEYSVYPEIIKKLYTAVKTETGTTVYYQTKILLQNGSIQDKSVFSVAIGASAAATDNYAVAIGFKSSADEMGSLSIGAYSEAKGKQGLALGYVAKAIGDFSTAVGQWSQANGDHAVAIGYGAITEKNQAGVAIGYESHSMRAGGNGWNPITDQVWDGSEAQIEALGLKEKVKALDEEIAQKQALEQQAKEELAKFPNDPDLIEKARVAHNEKAKADEKKNKLFATWKTPTGDVAVGNSDTGMTRQITGVAAGSEDTDAVNVAQLKALNRKNVTQLNALNSKVDTFDNKIENIKNIANGNKIHYFSVGPDNEKNYPAGENYNNDGVEQHGGIAIGFDASSKDGDGIAIGKSAQARGWESTGIGALTYSIGDFSTSIGTRAQAFGKSASAYGALARAYGANGVAIGTGSLVASKKSITKAEFDVLSEEQKALYNIDKVNPKEFYQYRGIDKDGEVKDIETNGTAVGNGAKSIGIGGVAVGDHAKSSDINNVNGSNFGVAIGAYSQNKVAQGVALGAVSVSDREGNIRGYLPTKNGIIENFEDAMEAVGKGKEFTELKNEYAQLQEQMNAAKAAYDRDPTNTDLKTKYEQEKQKFDALTTKYAIMTAPWTSRKGAVSIGNDKKGQTRQIIGVAAGSEDTDAVNVAQLKALNRKVDTVDTKIETVKNIADGNKIHYLSIGPDNEKNHPAEGNYNNDGAHVYGAIAIGIDSVSEDADAISIGRKSYTNGWESIGIGPLAHATGNYTTVVGHRAQAFGESASAYGALARAYGANGIAIGTAALTAGVKPLTKAEFDALPEEQKAWYNTDGVKQTEFYQYKMRDKTGKITDIITKGTAVGNYAESIGIGGIAVGDHAKSSDIDNVNGSNFGVALGAYSQNKVAQGVALGTLSVADRAGNKFGYLPTKNGIIDYPDDAMEAVGKGKEFTELKNEYLQAQEQMNAAKAESDGNPTDPDLKTKYEQAKQKFDELTNKYAIMTAPWVSRKGAVSIGNDKKGQTRQIIGVAAGSEDTDAVNVAQLKAGRTTVEAGDYVTVTSGQKEGVDGTVYTVKGPKLSIDGGNLTVADDEETIAGTTDKRKTGYKLSLNKELTGLTSVSSTTFKAGDNVTLGGTGLTIANGPSVTVTGIDADSKTITNVKAGAADGDAVNFKQLKDVDSKVTKNATDITNLTTRVDGHDTAIAKNAEDITTNKNAIAKNAGDITTNKNAIAKNAGDITTNKNAIAKNAGDITTNKNAIAKNAGDITTNKNAIAKNTGDITTLTGRVDTAETTIKSNTDRIEKNATDIAGKMTSWTVKAGAEDADGQKIDNTNNEVTFNATGAGLTVERKDSTITYGIDGSKIDLSNNESIKKLKTVVKAGDKEKNISVVKTADKEEYTLTLAKNLKGLDSVSATTVNAGTVKASDKITVGEGDTVTIDKDGLTIKGGPSVKKDGIDAGSKTIANVADGQKDSDAVNYKQLKQAMQGVTKVSGEINRGDALGAALSALKPLDYDPYNRSQIMAGVSTYKGQEAIALGLAYYSNENTLLHAGLSYAGSSELMANAGISYRFGSSYDRKFLEERNKLMPQYKGGVISSVYVMQDEMTKLQKENEILKEKNAKAEAENKEMKSELEILKKQVSKLMEKI